MEGSDELMYQNSEMSLTPGAVHIQGAVKEGHSKP
jgi:hypothetical protein